MTDASRWARESRPRLRGGVLIAPADGGRWQVRWGFDDVLFISGRSCDVVLPWLVPRLDGLSPMEALAHCAVEQGCADAFQEIIDCLSEQRLLEDASRDLNDPAIQELSAAIDALGGEGPLVLPALAETKIVVLGRSSLATRVAASLQAQGFARARLNAPESKLPENAFLIAVETDCSKGQLGRANAWALSGRRPWMLTAAWNRRVMVGPIFIPGETACFDCCRKRLASHRAHVAAWEALEQWQLTRPAPAPAEPILPAVIELAAAQTALEVFHFMTRIRPARTIGRVLVHHPAEAEQSIETVLRIPWCDACSNVPSVSSTEPEHSRSPFST